MPDLQDVLDRVRQRFPRTDAVLESMLAEDILSTHIPDICRHYPWWFLEGGAVGGGGTFQDAFPVTDSDLTAWTFPYGNWLDRGWLLIDDGVDSYVCADTAKPGDGDTDASTWSAVLVNRLTTVRIWDLSGECSGKLEVLYPEIFKDYAMYGDTECKPRRVTVVEEYVDGERVSVLKVNPVPDKKYVLQVDFSLQIPPTVSTGGGANDKTNVLIDTYPEVAITVGMLAAAEYFNEARAIEYYTRKLWGAPTKASVAKTAESGGYIGRMKRDNRIRKLQREKSLRYHKGNPYSDRPRARASSRQPWFGYYRY